MAAGLESQILGEDHILAQVRSAFAQASAAGSAGRILSALFRTAIHAGRRVRSETGINQTSRSFARIAVQHVVRRLGPAPVECMLIVGSGAMARDAAHSAAAHGVQHLVLASRDAQRARQVAAEFNGTGIGLDELPAALDRATALITCTKASEMLITPAVLQSRRPVIVDLGVPRNVHPAVQGISGVDVAWLDDLPLCHALQSREAKHAERIVAEQLQGLNARLRKRCTPTLSGFNLKGGFAA